MKAQMGFLRSVKVRVVHPYQWLWESLEMDAGFVLKPMFGGKAAYLDGKLALYFTAKQEPWRGLCVCTDRVHHDSLIREFPELKPHAILPKWLYLSEASDRFESVAERLVRLAAKRDERLGVVPKPKRKRRIAVRNLMKPEFGYKVAAKKAPSSAKTGKPGTIHRKGKPGRR